MTQFWMVNFGKEVKTLVH